MKKMMKILLTLFTSVLFLIPVNVFAFGNPYYGGYSNCTWTAWELAYAATGIAMPNFGNAGNWIGAAAAHGFSTGSQPAANSIIVWSGHVGFVASVNYDAGTVYVKEGGYLGHYNERVVSAYSGSNGRALLGYIYLNGGSPQYYDPSPITPIAPLAPSQARASQNNIVRAAQKPQEKSMKTTGEELIKDSSVIITLGSGISIKDKSVDMSSTDNEVIFVDDISKETSSKPEKDTISDAIPSKDAETIEKNSKEKETGSVIEIIEMTPEAKKAQSQTR